MDKDYSEYGPLVLRIVLGLFFIIVGFNKLLNPSKIIGMLTKLGFIAPSFFGWVLLLSEILFGLAILVGWKLKYNVWPLIVVLLVAIITVHAPNLGKDPFGLITILFHILGIATLISLYLTGPGKIHV